MSEAKIVLTAVDNTSRAFASARQGLSGLGSAAATVKTALTGIGVVAAASYLSTMVEETKRAIDSFKDLSDATGASVENVSALDRVARATGGTFDQVSGILVKFNQMLNEADPKKGAGAVLKSLNLDIAELKKLDPAEALRRTAVALQGFADDGVKARAVQELFGKSVREAAPFLKDLAESGKLVGTVSDRAADEVDRFNKQLSLIKANATDVERALTIDIITSVNELIERYKVGQREGKAFWEIAWQGYKQDVRSFWGMSQEDPRADIRREIADAERDLEALRARKSRPFNFAADLDKEISAAEKKVVDAQRRLYASGLSGGRNAGGGRGFVNPDLVRPQLIVKEEGKEPKKPKEKADFVGPIYDDPIALKVDRLFEDGDVSNARVYAATVERLDDLFFSGAIGVELYDAAMKELNGSTSAGADQTSKFTKEQMRLAELLGNTESAGIEAQRRDMELLAKALEEGRISNEQFIESAKARLNLVSQELKSAKGFAEEFGLTFSSAMEDAIVKGGSFRDVLSGVAEDLARIVIRKSVTEPLGDAISNLDWGSLFASANGNVFSNAPGLSAYSSTIVSRPTIFPFAKGIGLMGEAGDEAIMPLQRLANGKLGVGAASGGGSSIKVEIINPAGAPMRVASQTQTQGANGETVLRLVMESVGDALANRSGPVARGLEAGYGLRPAIG